jgi:ribosomal protein S5
LYFFQTINIFTISPNFRPIKKYRFNHFIIEIVNEFNYLGILLNRTGNFNKAITKQAEKAKQAMYEVLKRGRTHNLSVECQLELSDKMVKPILLYGSEIWGYSKNIDCLEKIQLRFCAL